MRQSNELSKRILRVTKFQTAKLNDCRSGFKIVVQSGARRRKCSAEIPVSCMNKVVSSKNRFSFDFSFRRGWSADLICEKKSREK